MQEPDDDVLIDVEDNEPLGPRARRITGEVAAVPGLTGFERAVILALRLHEHQQRKGTDIPYAAHLLTVAGLVLEDGGTETQAIAALLHDAAEDQGGMAALEAIRSLFGDGVAAIVESCTDTFEHPKPPWKERKTRYLERLQTEPLESLEVSLADKVHNAGAIVRDLETHGRAVWKRFNVGAGDQLWYYRSLADVFWARHPSPRAAELRRLVDRMEQLGAAQP
ncbi:MAG TPA: HD domain-containing protein [Actinomycetota bacterium]